MKKIKFVARIFLILVILFLGIIFINRSTITDKLITRMYLLKYGLNFEFISEETEDVGLLIPVKMRIKTYYDEKNDFEFHLYYRNQLFTNLITKDDYYQSKLQNNIEQIIVDEILDGVLENEYYIVTEGYDDAIRESTIESGCPYVDIFTWAAFDFDNIGQKVMKKLDECVKITEKREINLFIFDSYSEYKDKVNSIDNQNRDSKFYDMEWDIEEEDILLYENLIYCYSQNKKWLNSP